MFSIPSNAHNIYISLICSVHQKFFSGHWHSRFIFFISWVFYCTLPYMMFLVLSHKIYEIYAFNDIELRIFQQEMFSLDVEVIKVIVFNWFLCNKKHLASPTIILHLFPLRRKVVQKGIIEILFPIFYALCLVKNNHLYVKLIFALPPVQEVVTHSIKLICKMGHYFLDIQ